MKTHWIEREVTGSSMRAYVAEPRGVPKAGVIVLQEIYGVNDFVRTIAEGVAREGYLAIAPDLYHRTDPGLDLSRPEGQERGIAAAFATTLPQIVADLTASGAYLSERLGPEAQIGTWGFCFGGSIAFISATLPFVRCAVSFYGGSIARSPVPDRPAWIEQAREVRAPIFFAFGGADEHIPPEDRETIRKALDGRGKHYEMHVPEGEGHAFFRLGSESNAGSREIWPRVQAFLARYLIL